MVFLFNRGRFGLALLGMTLAASNLVTRREEEKLSYFTPTKAGQETPVGNGTGGAVRLSETATAKKSADTMSTLGPGIVITGNILCEGSAQIFGRVVGDIQATEIIIGDGARVEGNITALDVAINGAFKGTIRGNNVKLKGAATIDGEIFSKSLTVEENVQFEGMSRRLEKPIELSAITQTATVKPVTMAPAKAGAVAEAAA
jgi:cytoskeletal protein CcmA (bactofilin family)